MFEHYPSPLDRQHPLWGNASGEPSIGVNWLSGAAMVVFLTTVARVTWDGTTTPATATWAEVTHPLGSALTFDPFLVTDSSKGRTFVAQLIATPVTATTGFGQVLYTDDDGATWQPSAPAVAAPSFDHPSIAVGSYGPNPPPGAGLVYPHAVYYCAQYGIGQCARSDDGGLTWGPPFPTSSYLEPACLGLFGTVMLGLDGALVVPYRNCPDSGASRQGLQRSKDHGLTWERIVFPGSLQSKSDPNVAFDEAGNLYAAWSQGKEGNAIEPAGPVLASRLSPDGSWGPAMDLGLAKGVRSAVFPEVVAGDEGRAAVAFLGTTQEGAVEDCDADLEWHLYVSITTDGGLTWTTVDTTPTDPVQRGGIWLSGAGGSPCRNLLDFMGIAVDEDGRVLVSYADGCTDERCIVVGGTSLLRDSRGSIARQVGGERMRAGPPLHAPLSLALRGGVAVQDWPAHVEVAGIGGGPPYTYAWDLNEDGSYDDASSSRPAVATDQAGIRRVYVKVRDATGQEVSGSAWFEVFAPIEHTEMKRYVASSQPVCADHPGPALGCVTFRVPENALHARIILEDALRGPVAGIACVTVCNVLPACIPPCPEAVLVQNFCGEVTIPVLETEPVMVLVDAAITPLACGPFPSVVPPGTLGEVVANFFN